MARKSPISALNLKNPGPITSLLQSYRASTTCQNFRFSNMGIMHRTNVVVDLSYMNIPDHFSRNGESSPYHGHP